MNDIQLVRGQRWDPLLPEPERIDIETIAVVLSKLPRFGGHTCRGYALSVLDHSINVCDLITNPKLKVAGLLHDAHEAYTGVGDVCTPIKSITMIGGSTLKEVELAIDAAIAAAFGFPVSLFYEKEVRDADYLMFSTEVYWFMADRGFQWPDRPAPLEAMPSRYGSYGVKRFLDLYARYIRLV